MLLLVLWWIPNHVDLSASIERYYQHTVLRAIAASTGDNQDVYRAALSLLAEAGGYVGVLRKLAMVFCRWHGRLAFLWVASWLCVVRDFRGVVVVFLFLAVVL